jgi:hypothetical protein
MSSQASDTPESIIPFVPKVRNAVSNSADLLDNAGQVILDIVHRAADKAGENLQQARQLCGSASSR